MVYLLQELRRCIESQLWFSTFPCLCQWEWPLLIAFSSGFSQSFFLWLLMQTIKNQKSRFLESFFKNFFLQWLWTGSMDVSFLVNYMAAAVWSLSGFTKMRSSMGHYLVGHGVSESHPCDSVLLYLRSSTLLRHIIYPLKYIYVTNMLMSFLCVDSIHSYLRNGFYNLLIQHIT